MTRRGVSIPADGVSLLGDLTLPEVPSGVVLFAHGSGSGRLSPRNGFVASRLNEQGLATLLIDLLTEEEERAEAVSRHLRFDIGMLAERLGGATQWLRQDPKLQSLPIGYFGASTGAGAALVAAVRHPDDVAAVVSRGGRPDLAGDALPRVGAATQLIVGSRDETVLALNQQALAALTVEPKALEVVPGATHLFEEPGTFERVADLAAAWFRLHLGKSENVEVQR